MGQASDEQQLLLAALPPSKRQIRLALSIVVALLIAMGLTSPFLDIELPRIDGFIPALETAIVINALITSALLFSQFIIARRWALLMIASGYLYTALIVIPHAFTFPGAFAPEGLLGAGLQSSAWLYVFWHAGLLVAVIVYVVLKDADSGTRMPKRTAAAIIAWSVAAVIAIVCGLSWIAIAGEWFLPALLDDVAQNNRVSMLLSGIFLASLSGVALTLLWVRRRSVLDLWLIVMCSTLLLEVTMTTIVGSNRFTLGWYASKTYGLVATIFVLLVLLSETTALYAHLARSIMKQRGDREARQIAMDAMAASIAHEVNQPLAAMVTNANAGLRWLANKSPDLDEVREALTRIVGSGHRASEVIAGVRVMFKKDVHGRAWLSVNEVVREALTMVDVDLRAQRVLVSTGLHEGLPLLLADRAQLQQVFLNLIMNAIEAMRSVTDRPRLLRITSEIIQESSSILITVEDSGIGIDSNTKDRIFEPFFTTKSTGTGIGLGICRSIVESHEGSLVATANRPYGTIFRVNLPISDM